MKRAYERLEVFITVLQKEKKETEASASCWVGLDTEEIVRDKQHGGQVFRIWGLALILFLASYLQGFGTCRYHLFSRRALFLACSNVV